MKTLISYVALTVFVLASSFTIDVQQNLNARSAKKANGSFNYFKVHRQGKGIAMMWSVSSTNAAQFVVERSFDGEYFDTISTIDCNGASRYNYNDGDVYPGYLYYRISCLDANGLVEETSAVEVVHIVQRK